MRRSNLELFMFICSFGFSVLLFHEIQRDFNQRLTTVFQLDKCTALDAERQADIYERLIKKSKTWSACYSDEFLLEIYQADLDREATLMIDVGANKGYTFTTWLSIWMPHLNVNPYNLYAFMKDQLKIDQCGNCQDCKTNLFDRFSLDFNRHRQLEIHAFEPQTSTFNLLRSIRDWINVSSIHIHQVALSNLTSSRLFQKCPQGYEICSFIPTNNGRENLQKSILVNVTTLDKFISDRRLFRPITLLKIDTEGFDPLVLAGAQQILDRQQVRVLLFEYHGIGAWKSTTLYKILTNLDVQGYICYMIGQTGLIQLTSCWSTRFEKKRWSNIICVSNRESLLLHRMQRLLV